MTRDEQKAFLEALLFLEHESVSIKQLIKNSGFDEQLIHELIHELIDEYSVRQSGLLISEVAEGFQMTAHPRFSLLLSKLYGSKQKSRLSRTLLEVLAIIAYKQPVTKSEIEKIRGVSCDRAIKQLMEKELVSISGRRETPGKPLEFGTTKQFLKIFGLKSINALPKLREIKDMEFGRDDDDDDELAEDIILEAEDAANEIDEQDNTQKNN